jgi:hypothetical protein
MSNRGSHVPSIGLAVATLGRPTLGRLLMSAARSSRHPSVVAVANQSGGPLDLPSVELPFPVRVVESEGGASRGRNDAVRALDGDAEVVGFPNDDSSYPEQTLRAVAEAFSAPDEPAAVACAFIEGDCPRFKLPPIGPMTRTTVWRAIEPAMFTELARFLAIGGFREDLGTGCPTPWQSGEGTDLLLRLLQAGETVMSRPDFCVIGTSERRDLTADGLVLKHRRYARGTGYIYRIHRYPTHARLRILVAPWLRATGHDAILAVSLRIALARSLGRLEGLVAHPLPTTRRENNLVHESLGTARHGPDDERR